MESFKQREEIQRAYLAQVMSGEQAGVALCIRTQHGADPNLVRAIGSKFAAIHDAYIRGILGCWSTPVASFWKRSLLFRIWGCSSIVWTRLFVADAAKPMDAIPARV
ncbi:MAG: hypothetical protein ACRET2_04000 [Steroidobacteraceae bacterium]